MGEAQLDDAPILAVVEANDQIPDAPQGRDGTLTLQTRPARSSASSNGSGSAGGRRPGANTRMESGSECGGGALSTPSVPSDRAVGR